MTERGPTTRYFLDNYRVEPESGDVIPACIVALGRDTVRAVVIDAATDTRHPNDGRVKIAVADCTNELADIIRQSGAEETLAPVLPA